MRPPKAALAMAAILLAGCATAPTHPTSSAAASYHSTLLSPFSLSCSYMSEPGCVDPAVGALTSSGGIPGSKGKWVDGGGKCNNEMRVGSTHEYGLVNAPHPSSIDGGSDDLEGIVVSGASDDEGAFQCHGGECHYPHLAHEDNPCHHQDRDINIELVPTTDWTRAARRYAPLSAANLIDSNGTRGSIVSETEWMNFFPTWPSCRAAGLDCSSPGDLAADTPVYPGDDSGGVQVDGGIPTPPLSAVSNSGDSGYLGVPYRGDEIVIRGRHTYDCGHSWGYDDSNLIGPGSTQYPLSNNQACQSVLDCAGTECGHLTCAGTLMNTGLPCPPGVGHDANGRPFCLPGCSLGLTGGIECQCSGGWCQVGRSFSAELHPFSAVMWLHPTAGAAGEAKVWLYAMSHEPYPIGAAPINTTPYPFSASGVMATRFHIPGGAGSTNESLYIQPLLTDWVLDPQTQKIDWPCDTGSTDCGSGIPDFDPQPWSYFGRAGKCSNGPVTTPDLTGSAKDYFTISPVDNHDGTLSVSVTQVPGTERMSSQVPAIVGAHFRVCYPQCSNGIKENTCPIDCKPTAPTRLAGTVNTALSGYNGTIAVNLTWTAANGATGGYNVYRSAAANPAFPGDYAKIGATGPAYPSYSDATAAANTAYSYVVTAVNTNTPAGEGPPSNAFSVATPPVPTLTITSVGTHHVAASWTTIPGAKGYNLYRGSIDYYGSCWSGKFASNLPSSATSYNDTSVSVGVPYCYLVTGITSSGESSPSMWRAATPLAVPAGLTVTAPPEGITASWSPVAGTDRYTLTGPGFSQEVIGTTLTGFPGAPGVPNCFSVAAGMESAMSDGSAPVCVTPGVPPGPTGLTAASEDTSVALSWTALANASGYKVYRDGAAIAGTCESCNSYTDTGLTTGVKHSYHVVADTQYGASLPSADVDAYPACDSATCSQGCCSGSVCMPGNQAATGCVRGGRACGAACQPGYACSAGRCAQPFDCSACSCGCNAAQTACRRDACPAHFLWNADTCSCQRAN